MAQNRLLGSYSHAASPPPSQQVFLMVGKHRSKRHKSLQPWCASVHRFFSRSGRGGGLQGARGTNSKLPLEDYILETHLTEASLSSVTQKGGTLRPRGSARHKPPWRTRLVFEDLGGPAAPPETYEAVEKGAD